MPSQKETKEGSNYQIGLTKLNFYGHSLTDAGLEPDGTKVKAIMEKSWKVFGTHELFVKVYAKIGRRDIFVATVEER
jgi:hypothetical protein